MPTQPYPPLLQVYYFGLVHSIVSKQDITAWSDSIIMAEDEPDYFFIELSTARDENELLTAINDVGDTALTLLSARAVLGLIWQRFESGNITAKGAVDLFLTLPGRDVLTSSEMSEIYDLEKHFYPTDFDDEEFEENRRESVFQFLKYYATLRLDNYREWEKIHTDIVLILAGKETQDQHRLERWRMEHQQAYLTAERKSIYTLISYGLGAVTFFISLQGYSRLDSDQPMSQLFWDIWALSMLYFMFFACYHVVLAARSVLRKLFSKYF